MNDLSCRVASHIELVRIFANLDIVKGGSCLWVGLIWIIFWLFIIGRRRKAAR